MSEENNSFFINDENGIYNPFYNNNEDESFEIMNYDKINPIVKNRIKSFDFLGSTAMKSKNFNKMENNEDQEDDQNIFKNINEKNNEWHFKLEKQIRTELKSFLQLGEPISIKKENTEQKDIFAIENDNSEKKTEKKLKKKLGRKKQKSSEEETYNKCSEDNIIIKIIVKGLNIIIKMINQKIDLMKEGGFLCKINLKPIKQNKAAIYQNLINSKIKDIIIK